MSPNKVFSNKRNLTIKKFLIKYNIYIIFAALVIVSSIISEYFLTWDNSINILRQQSLFIVMGMGMLLVLISGGIDLSITSIAALSSIIITEIVITYSFTTGWGMVFAIVLALAVCAALGALSGLLISILKMPSFIITLAMGYVATGLSFMASKGAARMLDVIQPASKFLTAFGQNSDPLLGIPYQIYFTILFVAAIAFVLKFTIFGRLLISIGSNENAVIMAGINVKKYKFLVYVLAAVFSGVAGIILVASCGSSTPLTTNADYAMIVISGVIVGGASMYGGEGSALKSVFGILVIGLISNIMNLAYVPVYPQTIVRAVLIILAVLLKSVTEKKE